MWRVLLHFYGDILKQRKEITNLIVLQAAHIEKASWLGEDGILVFLMGILRTFNYLPLLLFLFRLRLYYIPLF